MTNIFENAYFGKVYKTRDGRKAIYLSKGKTLIFSAIHRLAIEPTKFSTVESIGRYGDSGICTNGFYDCDIVSEWQEEIDEEELHRIAAEEANKFPILNPKEGKNVAFYKGYKSGYRKAKQE